MKGTLDAIAKGYRRICITAPTGAGKTFIMETIARHFLGTGKKVVAYTNRKMLVDQLSSNLTAAGMYHGVRAADYEDEREHDFQISSIQTEHSRCVKRKTWNLHEADLAIIDEAHIQTGQTVRNILDAHYEEHNACYVGLTATPLGLAGIYDTLISAGCMSELRSCGALVPAVHYAADEPDMKSFKKMQEGQDPSHAEQKKAMMTPSIFGRVWEWYCKLNPDQKPCILFGPGVNESLWFAEQFHKKGIPAAHIDGSDVWINGEWFKSDSDARAIVKARMKSGEIKVTCNRFVLREGIDWPWVEHVILAFVAGSLQTYIQTVGRGLRACPSTGKTQLVIQDHGGNWWRHGSINADREWNLDFTDPMVCGLRAERLRAKKQSEPFRCPRCGRVWMVGTSCQPAHGGCGFELGNQRRSRPVVSTDGSLHEMTGDVFRPRRISQDPSDIKRWEKMYWRSIKGKGEKTFRQAMALFAYENNWRWPNQLWPFMPVNELDYFRLVSEVPRERLR